MQAYQFTGWLGGELMKAIVRVRRNKANSIAAQEQQLLGLVDHAKATVFGTEHDFGTIRGIDDYQDKVQLRTYEQFWKKYWSPSFPVLDNVTWPGRIRYFARSSGTTTGESKHIPCSDEMVKANNRAGTEVLFQHLRNNPKSRVASGRTFLFGGSPNLDELTRGVFAGELSGISARETPRWAGRDRYYPPAELAAITDWNEKVERLGRDCLGRNIRTVSGVPTWLEVLFDRAFEAAGIEDRRLVSLFPDLALIAHGGISFEPYEDRFQELLVGSEAELREVYAASEAFIAIADRAYRQGLKLLVDNGVFFEFVEPSQLSSTNPDRRWLANVELDTDYAVIVSTCAGLWAYSVGDIVRFVDLDPPRLLVVGRVSQTLSSFGEHVSGEQLERAVSEAVSAAGGSVHDFTVAPVHSSVRRHRYVIETPSGDPTAIGTGIDASLARQNADYRTKRANDLAISAPEVILVPPGTHTTWMTQRGQAGGQHKVPRVTTTDIQDQIVSSRSRC